MKEALQKILLRFALPFVESDWGKLRLNIANRVALLQCTPSIDELLVDYLVLGEDRRHGHHLGFDVFAICRALWRRVTSDKKEGASTIAQQLVRTVTNRREPTFRRKVKEVLLSVLVTRFFDSTDIAKVYLKAAYYGWQMNNLEEACCRLGLDQSSIPAFEAAALIARLKYPESHNASIKRRTQILNRTYYLTRLSREKRDVRKNIFARPITSNETI